MDWDVHYHVEANGHEVILLTNIGASQSRV